MDTDEHQIAAPFNNALASLELLHKISDLIVRISANQSVDINDPNSISPGKSQHMKYRVVRQYFIMAIVLIPPDQTEWIEEMKTRVFGFESQLVYAKQVDTNQNKQIGIIEIYDKDFEMLLDVTLMDIRVKLQEEGYFMPPKHDPKNIWKQT